MFIIIFNCFTNCYTTQIKIRYLPMLTVLYTRPKCITIYMLLYVQVFAEVYLSYEQFK